MKNKKNYFKEYEYLDEELPDLCNRYSCSSNKAKDFYFIVDRDSNLMYSIYTYDFDDVVYCETLNKKQAVVARKICDNCVTEFLYINNKNKEDVIIIPEEKIYLYKILG